MRHDALGYEIFWGRFPENHLLDVCLLMVFLGIQGLQDVFNHQFLANHGLAKSGWDLKYLTFMMYLKDNRYAFIHMCIENNWTSIHLICRSVKKFSQTSVNRKRKFSQCPAPSSLRLHDFVKKRRDKLRGNPTVNLKVAKTTNVSHRDEIPPSMKYSLRTYVCIDLIKKIKSMHMSWLHRYKRDYMVIPV